MAFRDCVPGTLGDSKSSEGRLRYSDPTVSDDIDAPDVSPFPDFQPVALTNNADEEGGLDACATILCGVILAKLLYALRRVEQHLGSLSRSNSFKSRSNQILVQWRHTGWYTAETRIPHERRSNPSKSCGSNAESSENLYSYDPATLLTTFRSRYRLRQCPFLVINAAFTSIDCRQDTEWPDSHRLRRP